MPILLKSPILRCRPLTLLLVVAALASPNFLHAQADLQQQLIAADRGLLEALSGPHSDTEKYEKLLAPDYVDIEDGTIHSRDEDVAQTKVLRDFAFQYDKPHAVVLSPTSGYVTAEVRFTASINGAGVQDHLVSTTIFTLVAGKWLARLQATQPMTTTSKAAAVPDDDPTLVALRKLASEVEAQVHIPGYPAFTPPKIMLDAGTSVSRFTFGDDTVHAAQFADLPPPMQGIWEKWATYTDEPNGKALFDDMFHRFFFVHELGHWMAGHVIAGLPESERGVIAKNEGTHKWEFEVAANRIAVAWYREHDPEYLAKLVENFRKIEAHLPNPVPAGVDMKSYFTDNYRNLAKDPMAYGWYQLQMVLVVYDEPARSFQQVVNDLPKNRYE